MVRIRLSCLTRSWHMCDYGEGLAPLLCPFLAQVWPGTLGSTSHFLHGSEEEECLAMESHGGDKTL